MNKKSQYKFYSKQLIRSKISLFASYSEIYVSVLVLIGILLYSIHIFQDLYVMLLDDFFGTHRIDISDFLAPIFDLIIGIEFVKMLAKHTPSSAVEVILFAIARQLVGSHGDLLDSLIGVIAIAILFAIRKYLNETIHLSNESEYIVEGGINIDMLNEKLGTHIDHALGNSLGGVIYNASVKEGRALAIGYEISLNGYRFQVYSMDKGIVLQVKIIKEE